MDTAEQITYILNYNANGGSGAPSVTTKYGNSKYAIFQADASVPSREGFDFVGWSFTRDGEAKVQANDFFTVTSTNTTLYAVWVEEGKASESSEEENASPLGVVAVSGEPSAPNTMFDSAVILGCTAAMVAAVAIFALVARARRPRIISKKIEK